MTWKAPLLYTEFLEFRHVLVEMGKTIQQQMDVIRNSEEEYHVLFESFPL